MTDVTRPGRMVVQGVFAIRGRPAISAVLAGPEPEVGTRLRRMADGAEWTIGGVEWWAIIRRPGPGESVSFLLDDEAKPRVGDEFEEIEDGGKKDDRESQARR